MAFKSSTHKFTDPIRIFKANDPYHFVIDNLPLQQLLDNDRWLKDQIDSGVVYESGTRAGFQELKPFANGSDNIVHVNPGQYHARINDAYSKTQMQRLKLFNYIAGKRTFSNEDEFTKEQMNEIVRRIKSSIASDALFLNGLTEQTNLWQPEILQGSNISDSAYSAGGSNYISVGGSRDLPLYSKVNYNDLIRLELKHDTLQKLSTEFIRMYRGVGRISVVSVDEELTIEVPAFDERDFIFRNQLTGVDEILPAQHRIDLVFIYSHPIDASSTNLPKYSGTSLIPQTITKPVLGVVKGAGLFVTSSVTGRDSFVGDDGKSNTYPQILASVADQINSNNGFKSLNVHGSFPSPEDLMNMAPNIVENLESNNIQLLGQSVFPVCYVVVRKNATINAAGQQIITPSDVIDIRPFFRTAELTYNERAGILMATPPLSPANTAVGTYQLDRELSNLFERVRSDLLGQGSDIQIPKVVAGGTIWGGRKFGPEGAIRLAAKELNGIGDSSLPLTEAPILPDWDLAYYWNMNPPAGTTTDKGQRRNDYINTYILGPGNSFDTGTGADTISAAIKTIGTEKSLAGVNTQQTRSGAYSVHWCKKEILIDRTNVPWMNDYTVDCQFENCFPQTSRNNESGSQSVSDDAGSAAIWVEKKFDRFIIYVAWVANTIRAWQQSGNAEGEPRNNRDSAAYSGFIVRNSDMGLPTTNNVTYNNISAAGNNASTKAPHMGACTYPTVSFKITGYPSSYFFKTLAQGTNIATIVLK